MILVIPFRSVDTTSTARSFPGNLPMVIYLCSSSLLALFNTGFNDWMIDYADYLPNVSFLQLEKKLFRFFGRDSYQSIVKKYAKACHAVKMKRVYRAPLSTRILLHLYALFFE